MVQNGIRCLFASLVVKPVSGKGISEDFFTPGVQNFTGNGKSAASPGQKIWGPGRQYNQFQLVKGKFTFPQKTSVRIYL